MPIRPENVARYPANWKAEIRPRILKRSENENGWPCCEECGVANGDVGYRGPDDSWQSWPAHELREVMETKDGVDYRCIKIVLTIAHLSDEIEDCSDENLRAWCQRCHNRYDAPKRAAGIQARRRAERAVGDLFYEEA